jgi:hypothetical protein
MSGFGTFGQLQAEGHVVVQAHVRVQRVALEHHRDAALGRRHVVDHALADAQLARADVLQPAITRSSVDLPQPEGPDEDHELAVPDLQVDTVQDPDFAEVLDHAGQTDVCHATPPRHSRFVV